MSLWNQENSSDNIRRVRAMPLSLPTWRKLQAGPQTTDVPCHTRRNGMHTSEQLDELRLPVECSASHIVLHSDRQLQLSKHLRIADLLIPSPLAPSQPAMNFV